MSGHLINICNSHYFLVTSIACCVPSVAIFAQRCSLSLGFSRRTEDFLHLKVEYRKQGKEWAGKVFGTGVKKRGA